jgi:DNA end-binding protein Ku
MRSIWTGAIGFGLVNIPVKLYSAIEDSDLDLDMLDKKDHGHIRFKRVNENTGKEVEWGNIIKAYDLDGQYVELDDADFEKAMPEKTKTIEISSFSMQQEINSLYYENPYYAEPAKGGERAYKLFYAALEKSGKVGLGSFVLRSKEKLCLVKPMNKVLVVQRIRFEQEIRDTADLKVPGSEPKPAELKMALSLIDQLTEKFDISAWKDSYSENLMKLIRAKAKGGKVKTATVKTMHTKTSDLMSQLQASLDAKRNTKKAS